MKSPEELGQRVCSEFLRRAAIAEYFLPADDVSSDEILSEDATNVREEECRRHYLAHQAKDSMGERVHVGHILLALTKRIAVAALRIRAETTLLDVRYRDDSQKEDVFVEASNTLSNCPSAADGGDLGWLSESETALKFSRKYFLTT